jgi:uncharacterized membrane protein (UPF0127 family)
MRTSERLVLVLIVVAIIGGVGWFYYAVEERRSDYRERVASGEFEQPITPAGALTAGIADESEIDESDWRRVYPVTYPMLVAGVPVQASVADTLSERMKGLSDTPFLPSNVVKLFAFGVEGDHSIWMKDMNYPIDILWADESGSIVHVEEQVQPDSYNPTDPRSSASYSAPNADAWFVVETKAGFIAQHDVRVGESIVLPE